MIVLIQRVRQASVEIDGDRVAEIGQGLLAFTGFEPEDNEQTVSRMLQRVLNYRVFADSNDKMNLSLRDTKGGLLLVPQFTLAADTTRGRRPSFTSAASPQLGNAWFELLMEQARHNHSNVQCGRFGADMQVFLQNDGPVTFILKQQ